MAAPPLPELADEAWPGTLQRLRALPARPRSLAGPENWANGARLFADYLFTVPPTLHRWSRRFRPAPNGFERVEFPSEDGTRLAGLLGRASRADADGLILVPGLYTSKDNYRIRARCARLRDAGLHVLALDLRGVGESDRTFSTPGWKEAQDLAAAIRFFRERARPRRIHLYCESLAASAAIVAAGRGGQAGEKLLDGRILVMSPFADARTIVDLYSTPHPHKTTLGRDFIAVQRFFNTLLWLQGYRKGRFDQYVRAGADHYGSTLEATMRDSSPDRFVRHVNVPLLVVHSLDDGLVPVSEAKLLEQHAAGNPNVNVWILPWGYHCLYEMAEPDWYWSVLSELFGASTPPSPRPALGVRAAST